MKRLFDLSKTSQFEDVVRDAQPLPEVCPKCRKPKPDIDRRYSYGVYAGKMCEDCAYHGFRDHCGLRGSEMGTEQDWNALGDVPYNEDY